MTKNTNKTRLSSSTPPRPTDLDTIPELSHPAKITKYINRAIVIALLITALGLGIFFKWSLEDTNILQIKNNPFPARVIDDPTGRTGGIVFLNVNYCKKSNLEGVVHASYVSKSNEIFLPVAKEQIPAGCNRQEVPVVIPIDLPKDVYRIKFRVIYDVNPLKRGVVQSFESLPFNVSGTINENNR